MSPPPLPTRSLYQSFLAMHLPCKGTSARPPRECHLVVVELPDQNCHHDLAVLQVLSEHIDHQNLGKVRRWCFVRSSFAVGTESLPTPSHLQKWQPSATATRLAAVATAALGGSSTLDNDDSDDSHATGHFERDVHDTFHAEKMHRDT
mmetsp:Transcript_33872/g.76131  ORF Transcript_33872/g.76131 Transcript_33872/m.76131 type:complete len:148 (-) Transcript_33872:698-1141(-)